MELSETVLRYVLDECVIFIRDNPSERIILDNSLFKNDMPQEYWDYLIKLLKPKDSEEQEYRS